MSAGGQGLRGQGPHPGRQRAAGAGGDGSGRAPRAAAGPPIGRLASTAARLRPGPILTTTAATKLALRLLGQRYQALEAELAAVDAELDRLTAQAAPRLRRLCGVGPEIAGVLLVAAGDNPERLGSAAAFSMLCGASPIPASSGRRCGIA